MGLVKLGVLFGTKDLPSGHIGFWGTRDPLPPSYSFESIVMDDLTYAIGSFDAYMDTSRDYAT